MNRHDIEILGKEVARQLGDGPSPARIEAQRDAVLARFEEMHSASRARRGATWRWALAGMALGMLAGILLWWRLAGVSQPAPASPGFGASTSQEQVVRLPDGNEMRLAAGSQGSVKEASSRQVRLSLVRGKLTSVVRVPVRWCVEAGPYYVEAAGTEYTVKWEAPRLEVAVAKGRVTVAMEEGGPALWKVDAGNRLVVENGKIAETSRMQAPVDENAPDPAGPEMHPEKEPDAQPQKPVPPEEEKNSEQTAPGAPASPLPQRQGVRPEPREPALPRPVPQENPPAPEWKRLLQVEDYRGAVTAMEQAGLAAFADTAALSDLQAMATAARYAGKPQTALVLHGFHAAPFPRNEGGFGGGLSHGTRIRRATGGPPGGRGLVFHVSERGARRRAGGGSPGPPHGFRAPVRHGCAGTGKRQAVAGTLSFESVRDAGTQNHRKIIHWKHSCNEY